jgi:transcription antitermination factor NusG
MLPVLRRWSDRKKLIEVPCFPGYVFVRCAEEERRRAFAVPGTVRYLGSGGRATPLDAAEVESVREALARRVAFEPHPRLGPGQEVRVVGGPLRGLSGILLRKERKYRLVLAVRAMGQGISAEVDASDVEPA